VWGQSGFCAGSIVTTPSVLNQMILVLFLCLAGACSQDGNETGETADPGSDVIATPALDVSSSEPDVPQSQTDTATSPAGGKDSTFPDPGPTDTSQTQPPDPVKKNTRFVRINTTQSPSWVAWSEVEVWGTWEGGNGVDANLALNKTVTASSVAKDSSASWVVDADHSTTWNSGDFPPATLTVDLGADAVISKVRLLVAQMPPGQTTHRLLYGTESGEFTEVHAFGEHTKAGQWLEFPVSGSTTVSPDTAQPPDVSAPPDTTVVPDPPQLPRGLNWVRNNPMFLSGLSVSTGTPTSAQASDYFNGFQATAAQFWNDGLPDVMAGWQAATPNTIRWVSWVDDHGKGKNGQVIGGVSKNPPGRIGYQIGDEPGLNGNGMEELKEIEIGVKAVRKADPDGLIIVNFSFWAKEIDEMLEYYGGKMDADVYSYDRYSMGYKEHDTMALIRKSALKWNKPYWRFMSSFYFIDEAPKYTESDYRWHAFVGLLYGYTGHTWFVYQANAPHKVASDLFPAQGGFGQKKLVPWHTIAKLNGEMRHLGRTITQLRSTDVRYAPGQALYLPKGLQKWSKGAGNDPYLVGFEAKGSGLFNVLDLAIGYFEDNAEETYVMIQNQHHKNADWPIDNLKEVTAVLSFDFSAAPEQLDTNHLLALNHKTGEVEKISLKSTGNSTRVLEYSLPAGEPLLFKYATDAPFVMGPEL